MSFCGTSRLSCVFVSSSTAEELLRNIYGYVSGSAKRSAQLQEMQEYFREKKHKMLKLATTRWLSRSECVNRVLENWNILENYFAIAVYEDKLKKCRINSRRTKKCLHKGILIISKIYLKNVQPL